MGKRGPKPMPKKLLRLRGSPRANLHGPEISGLKMGVADQAPDWITNSEARAEWRRVAGELNGIGLLARVDRAILGAYCTAWGELASATKALETADLVYYDANGNPRKTPWLTISRDARAQVQRLGAELGLSPSSRARVPAPKPVSSPNDLKKNLFG